MSSIFERVDGWLDNTQRDERAVSEQQKVVRAAEKSGDRSAVKRERDELEGLYAQRKASLANYRKVREQLRDMDPAEQSEDYWRDQVQDVRRLVEKAEKAVRFSRREEDRDERNYVQERREAVAAIAAAAQSDDARVQAAEARQAKAEVVNTRGELTELEAILVNLRGVESVAEGRLKKSRERLAARGAHGDGSRQAFVDICQLAAKRYYAGQRPSFYSQAGYWTVDFGLRGEPRGARSDCSQILLSLMFLCGMDDPTGEGFRGGYTGTMARLTRVGREDLKGGELLLKGSGWPFTHVEAVVDPGAGSRQLVGHGSPPVDHSEFSDWGQYIFVDPFRS